MARNLSVIEALGLTCPFGGNPYICEGSYYEFVGCCMYDPCADNSGRCLAIATTSANATNGRKYESILGFTCRNTDYSARRESTWSIFQMYAPYNGSGGRIMDLNMSCEGSVPYASEPDWMGSAGGIGSRFTNATSLTPYKPWRERILSIGNSQRESFTDEVTPIDVQRLDAVDDSKNRTASQWGSLARDDIIGLSVGISVFALVLLALLARFFWVSEMNKYSTLNKGPQTCESSPILPDDHLRQQACLEAETGSTGYPATYASSRVSHSNWHRGQQSLSQKDFSWYMELLWDTVLTVVPIFFIVLPVLALCLNNQPLSSHGDIILSIDRLVPTIYPLVFAAVAARFYKNLGRWHLEQPSGIRLATLEQIMGSQSFAGALERLLFVRTQVSIGFMILLVWAMSPLGGQAGARMVYRAQNNVTSNGSVHYLHSGYQVSSYSSVEYQNLLQLGAKSLYAASLLQGPAQKVAPRDIWEWPRIPQRDKSKPKGEFYDIDEDLFKRGDNAYYSLLGTKIQGLDFAKQSDAELKFPVETSHLELECTNRFEVFNASMYMRLPQYDPMYSTIDLMKGRVNGTSFWTRFSQGMTWEYYNRDWDYIQALGSPHLVYLSTRADLAKDATPAGNSILFNCSMKTVVMETEMHCGLNSTNPTCSAVRQRLIDIPEDGLSLLKRTMRSTRAVINLIRLFETADGGYYNLITSATDAYISGDNAPFNKEGLIDWTNYDSAKVSRRLTSALNTWHMATIDPLNHTSVAFREDPGPQKYLPISAAVPAFFNSTEGLVLTKVQVYKTDKRWTAVHLTASFILLILAALGLALRLLIHGPDVVGFASSMTRDNLYVPIPDGGTGLAGPDRARLLKDLRVQLADVSPEKDVGYIAFRTVPPYLEKGPEKNSEQQQGSWRPFENKRLYE